MTSSFKKLTGSRVELRVELPITEFKIYWSHAFAASRENLTLKGFRKGMVPEHLALQALDPQTLFSAGAEKAIKETLANIAEENNWTLIDRPTIDIKNTNDSFSYTAVFSIFPDVNLGNYRDSLRARRAELETKKAVITVSEKESADALEWLRTSRTPKGERPPELTDAFAQTLGKFKTLAELTTTVHEGIRAEKIHAEEERTCLHVIEDIIAAHPIDIPAIMVEKIKEHNPKIDDAAALKTISTHLIIYALAEKEKTQPTDEEIAAELAHYPAPKSRTAIDNKKLHDYIYERIQQKKVYDKLLGTHGD